MKSIIGVLLICVVSFLVAAKQDDKRFVAAFGGRRLALVIGNKSYSWKPLSNPVNDATAVAKALGELGFGQSDIHLVLDATRETLRRAKREFVQFVRPGDLAFVYYSGHGVEVHGANYLLPIDLPSDATEEYVEDEAVSAQSLLRELDDHGAQAKVMILDACRDNPLRSAKKDLSVGLARMEGRGSLILFATEAGRTASDSPGSSNSVFTRYLLEGLREPGVPLDDAMKRVARRVARATAGNQVPTLYGVMLEDLVLTRGPALFDRANVPVDQEAWDAVKNSGDPELIEQFRIQYPQSPYASVAALKIAALRRSTILTPSRASVISLTAGGSSSPSPLYQKWFDDYKSVNGVEINYRALAAQEGIKRISDGTIDFSAGSVTVTDEQLKAFEKENGYDLLLFPTTLEAVVPIYNVPGVTVPLNFTPQALAEIFIGKIRKWNDPAISAANPGIHLPTLDIVVVHRSDGTSATDCWTDYLSKVSFEWASKVGRGPFVDWPAGLGAKGNDGVAGLLKQQEGAIGYVEMTYASKNHWVVGNVQNSSGEFKRADLPSVQAAAASASTKSPGFCISITNAPGKGSYPISSYGCLLVPTKFKDPNRGEAVKTLLRWILKQAQTQTEELDYIKLPSALAAMEERQISIIH